MALTAILMTVFFQGLIASHDRVFYDADVRAKLPASASQALSRYEAQKHDLSAGIEANLAKLSLLGEVGQQKDLDFNTALLKERQKALKEIQPPLFAVGFFLNGTLLLWPALYMSLGWLLFCFRTKESMNFGRKRLMQVLIYAILVYIYYEWPLWVRNFVLGSHGRTVYYFTNYDIDPKSFFGQEAIIIGFSFLVAATWIRWTGFSTDIDIEREGELSNDEPYLSVSVVIRLQRHFYEWIAGSIVLGFGFVYFTSFYWNLVVTYRDPRYLLSALLAHSLWVLTWVFLTIPLAKSWRCVRLRRLHALEKLLKTNQLIPGKIEQADFETIDKLESLAGVRLSLAGAGVIFSLFLPVLQLLLHK